MSARLLVFLAWLVLVLVWLGSDLVQLVHAFDKLAARVEVIQCQ